MSKTFASRPSQSTQRGRGRGNTRPTISSQHTSTNSPQTGGGGVSVRESRTRGSTSVRGSRGQTFTPANTARRSRQMSEPQQSADPSNDDDNEQQNQQTNRGSGFTIVSPNDKKRQKILQQARQEEENYEAHVRQKTKSTFSYVGTVGGPAVSENDVRQKQFHAQRTAKLTNLEKQRQWREDGKRREQQEIDIKLAKARSQVEKNEEKKRQQELNSQANWDEERRRTNDRFLKSLESRPSDSMRHTHTDDINTTGMSAMSAPRAGYTHTDDRNATGMSAMSAHRAGENRAASRSYRKDRYSNQGDNPLDENRAMRDGKQATVEVTQHAQCQREEYKPQNETAEEKFQKMRIESTELETESESDPMSAYSPLQMSVVYTLQDMFPQYAFTYLINICEQTGFNLEVSADLLAQ